MSKEGSFPTVSPATTSIHYEQAHQQTRELVSFIDALLQGPTQQTARSARIEQVGLVTLVLRFEAHFVQTRPQAVAQSIRYYQEMLRALVRKTDIQLTMGSTFHFLLPGADQQGGQIVQERLWEAQLWHTLNTQEQEILRPSALTIGHSCCSVQQPDSAACVQEAAISRHIFEQTIDTINTIPGPPALLERETEPLKPIQSEQREEELQPSLNGDCYLRARQLGIPYLPSLPLNIPDKVRQVCSASLAYELQCYPLGKERNVLTVALSDPEDTRVLRRLQQETGLQIFPVMAPPQELQRVLAHLLQKK